VVGPAADDVAQGLLPHLPRLVRVDAEALELGARRRATGAELDAPVAEQVEDRRRLRGAHGVVVRLRHQPHAVADPQVLGLGRDGAIEDLGVRAVRVLLEEVVLHRPEAVEPDPVAEHRLLERVLVGPVLASVRPRPGDRDLVEQREPHAHAPSAPSADRPPLTARTRFSEHTPLMQPNLLDRDFYAGDPWPAYAWLRANAPVYWDPASELWALLLHEDVVWAETHPELFSSAQGSRPKSGANP